MRVIFQQGQPRMAEGDEFKEGGEIIIQSGGMKEDSFCRAAYFRGTAGARRPLSWPLLAKEVTNVGHAQHPHMGASAKRSPQPAAGCSCQWVPSTSPAPLCSRTGSILPRPPPGDAQALGSFSDVSPAPASKSRALHPCNDGGEVAAGFPPWVIPACPTTLTSTSQLQLKQVWF